MASSTEQEPTFCPLELDTDQLILLNRHLSNKLASVAFHYYQKYFNEDYFVTSIRQEDQTVLEHLLFHVYLVSTNFRNVYGADVIEDGKSYQSDELGKITVFQTGSVAEGLLSSKSDIDIMCCYSRFMATDKDLTESQNDVEIIEMKPGTSPGFVLIPESYNRMLTATRKGNHEFVQHGPAMMQHTYTGGTLSPPIECELTACVRLADWPLVSEEWFVRERQEWPCPETIASCRSTGCHIVPKQHPLNTEYENEWRYSMSLAEKVLTYTYTKEQRQAYVVTKYILKSHLFEEKGVSSYHLKTVMFWLCEQKPVATWMHQSLEENVRDLLTKLQQFLNKGNLPNYFIRGNNMIGHLSQEVLQGKVIKLETVLSDLQNSLKVNVKEADMPRALKLPFPIYELAEMEQIDDISTPLIYERFKANYLFAATRSLASDMPKEARELLLKVPVFVQCFYIDGHFKTDCFAPSCDSQCRECKLISKMNRVTYSVIQTLLSLLKNGGTIQMDVGELSDEVDVNNVSESFALCLMILANKSSKEYDLFLKLCCSIGTWANTTNNQTVLLCHCFVQAINHGCYMIQNKNEYPAERGKILHAINLVQQALECEPAVVHRSVIASWKVFINSPIITDLISEYYSQYSLDINWFIIEAAFFVCLHITMGTNPNRIRYHAISAAVQILLKGTSVVVESFYFAISAVVCLIIFAKDYNGVQELTKILIDIVHTQDQKCEELLLPLLHDMRGFLQNPFMAQDTCLDVMIKYGAKLTSVTGRLEYLREVAKRVTQDFGVPYLLASAGVAMFRENDLDMALTSLEEGYAALKDTGEMPASSQVALMAHINHAKTSSSTDDGMDYSKKASDLFVEAQSCGDLDNPSLLYYAIYLLDIDRFDVAINTLNKVAASKETFLQVNYFVPAASQTTRLVPELSEAIRGNQKKVFYPTALAKFLLIHFGVSAEQHMTALKDSLESLKLFLRTNKDPLDYNLIQSVADTYLLLAFAAKKVGEKTSALESLKKVKQIDKENLLIEEMLSNLQLQIELGSSEGHTQETETNKQVGAVISSELSMAKSDVELGSEKCLSQK